MFPFLCLRKMKVTEIINDLIAKKEPTEKDFPTVINGKLGITSDRNDAIYGEELRQFKDKLLQCDEFKDCEMLEFLPVPIIQNKEGKAISAVTMLIGDDTKFKGRCFLLSLDLSPTMYDPETMYEPVKDGVALTPVMYNPINFAPYRKLVLPVNVEGMQDDLKLVRAELNTLIDKVLENPAEYQTKGFRKVMARGIFERIETETSVKKSEYNLDINVNEPPQYSQVYYLHSEPVEGKENEVRMCVKPKIMHNSLKEKFLKKFDGKAIILEEELNKFLEENGANNGN